MRESVVGSQQKPCRKGQQGYRDDGRHEHGSYLIDQLLHGRLASLGILHHPDDLSQQSILPYLVRHKAESPFLIDGAGIDFRPLLLTDGDGLSTEHTLVHIRLAFAHHPVHGNALTGLHHHNIALTDGRNRQDAFPLRHQHRHGLGLKPNQLTDSSRSVPLGTFFQQPSQQDKGNDDTRCFEIDMRFDAPFQPKFGEEEIEDTEHISNTRAECHERIHIASAMFELLPGTDEESPSQHEHYGRGKQPHHDIHPMYMHPSHPKHHDGYGQHYRPKRPFFQAIISGLTSLFRFILGLSLRRYQEVVTGLLYRRLQYKR